MADDAVEAEKDLHHRVCRICFTSEKESPSLGPLLSPCNCVGSMRYVHAQCLSTWRACGPGRAASRCGVCRAEYQDGQIPGVLRLATRLPTMVAVVAFSLLLRLLRPSLHRWLPDAVWMSVMKPFKLQWQLLPSLRIRHLDAILRGLINGSLLFAVPAMVDHLVASVDGRHRHAMPRACELLLAMRLWRRLGSLAKLSMAMSKLQRERHLSVQARSPGWKNFTVAVASAHSAMNDTLEAVEFISWYSCDWETVRDIFRSWFLVTNCFSFSLTPHLAAEVHEVLSAGAWLCCSLARGRQVVRRLIWSAALRLERRPILV